MESFVSDADDYFENFYHRSDWLELTDPQKEALLKQSTFILLNYLDWIEEPDTATPTEAQESACCELAYHLKTTDVMKVQPTNIARSVKAGDVSVDFDVKRPITLIPQFVLALLEDEIYGLKGLGENNIGLYRT